MDISRYTTEDFVLDPAFREWVLYPNAEANLYWQKLLDTNPSKYIEAEEARKVIVQLLMKERQRLTGTEFRELWNEIDMDLSEDVRPYQKEKVIPINSFSTLQRGVSLTRDKPRYFSHYGFRVACILVLAVGLSLVAGYLTQQATVVELPQLVYEERHSDPGVKAHL